MSCLPGMQVKIACALALAGAFAVHAEIGITLSDSSWMQVGRLVNGSYVERTLPKLYYRNWLQSYGTVVGLDIRSTEHLSAGLGFGFSAGQPLYYATKIVGENKYFRVNISAVLSNAEIGYTVGDPASPRLQVKLGYFQYKYSQNNQNLGLYLMRGTVYPATIESGFARTETGLLGANVHWKLFDIWQNDLIFTSETRYRPLFDFSPAYVTQITPVRGLDIGAGINFYRLLSADEKLTTPGLDSSFRKNNSNASQGYPLYFYVDTTAGSGRDTTYYTHRGVKAMGRIAYDPKTLFSSRFFGPRDLIIYGEIGIIGLRNYPIYYEKIADRIPIMVGLNLPSLHFPRFRILDVLSLEVEHYSSHYPADVSQAAVYTSPTPFMTPLKFNSVPGDSLFTSDDWKWSLYAERKLWERTILRGQVACDHSRFIALDNFEKGANDEAMSQTFQADPDNPGKTKGVPFFQDWYWMVGLTFAF